jgi:hypothetical protein
MSAQNRMRVSNYILPFKSRPSTREAPRWSATPRLLFRPIRIETSNNDALNR